MNYHEQIFCILVSCNVIHGAFKLHRFSQGDVVFHNTVIKVGAGMSGNQKMDYAYFRNNLAIGGPDGGVNWGDYGAGPPSAAYIPEPGEHSSFDYDAVENPGEVSNFLAEDFEVVLKFMNVEIQKKNSKHKWF